MDNKSVHNDSSHGDTSETPNGVGPATIVVPILIVALITALCFLLVRYSRLLIFKFCYLRAPISPQVHREIRMFPDWDEERERVRRIRNRRMNAGAALPSTPPRDRIPYQISAAPPDAHGYHAYEAQLTSLPGIVIASRADSLQARLLQHRDEHHERMEDAQRLRQSVGVNPSAPPRVNPQVDLVPAAPVRLAPPASHLDN